MALHWHPHPVGDVVFSHDGKRNKYYFSPNVVIVLFVILYKVVLTLRWGIKLQRVSIIQLAIKMSEKNGTMFQCHLGTIIK